MDTLGSRISKYRIKNKLSQSQLGDLLFVSDKTVSSWEKDRTTPTLDIIFKMANIFKTSFYQLSMNEYSNMDNLELEILWILNNLIYFAAKYNDISLDSIKISNQIAKYYLTKVKDLDEALKQLGDQVLINLLDKLTIKLNLFKSLEYILYNLLAKIGYLLVFSIK